MTVPPYPEGFSSKTGACIGDEFLHGSTCQYSLSIIENKAGQNTYIALKKFKHRAVDGKKAIWVILDIMDYPELSKLEYLAIATCRRSKQDDLTLFAVVKVTDTELFSEIIRAYRANLAEGKIETVDSDDVECWNEGWGI